jgi:hypothetical protein
LALTLAQHITNVRQFSNTENNTGFVTDTEITRRLNEAGSELYDLIVAAFEHYYVSTNSFTLTGGVNGNSVALPSDFYKDVGLDRNPGTTSAETIHKIGSFLERNRPAGRVYLLRGNTLAVMPADNSAGSYMLYYTPKAPVLAPVTVIPRLAGIDNVVAITNAWTFAFASFTQADVGTYLVVTGAANPANNGTFLIASVANPQRVYTDPAVALVTETFGAGVVASYQAGGTVAQLDVTLSNWEEYVDIRAAIKVLTKREMETTSLQQDLAMLKERIRAMAANRSEEPSQVALADGAGMRWGSEDGR